MQLSSCPVAQGSFPPLPSIPPDWMWHKNTTKFLKWWSIFCQLHLLEQGEMSHQKGWYKILGMPTLWDVDSAACACSESTVTPFMWETLWRETMRIFFIAHPGQIDGLCCGHSLLSVYNVAFALHCPDPATPKENWFLPLRCPFTSPSSLVVFPLSIIPYLFFLFLLSSLSCPPSPLVPSLLCTFCHTLTPMSLRFCSIFISPRPSFHSLFCPPHSLWLSCHACLFYCFIQYLKAPS